MNKLRKVFALFLILVIIFPGETAHAFSFVPEFISHYNHHNEEHHSLSFLDFVGEHLSEGHHESKQHHEQDDCPTSHDHALVSFTFVIEKKIAFEPLMQGNLHFEEKTPLPPYRFIFSEFHSAIWQPPKLS